MFDGIIHRSGLGARRDHRHIGAAAAVVIHGGALTAGDLIGARTDERILAAPLVIKTVGGQYLGRRRIAVGQRAQIAGHHRIAVQLDRPVFAFGIVIRRPDVPAPDQFVIGIVSADHGVALEDLVAVFGVGSDVERRLAVLHLQILHQSRRRFPDNAEMIRRQRRTVAFVHDVEQVVGLFHGCHITVGHTRRAQVHGLYDADEKHARNARPARSDPGQHDRTRFDGRTLFESRGRRSYDRKHARGLVEHRLVPARGLARNGERLDVPQGEAHCSHAAGRVDEDRRFVERYGARILVLTARHGKRRRSHDHGYQFYESFHIAQIYFISV